MKLVSVTQKVQALSVHDPLISFLTFKQIFIIAGIVEVALAIYIFKSTNTFRQLVLVVWLSVVFISYHVGLYLIAFHGLCSCMGNLNSWLKMSNSSIATLRNGLLAYLAIGSVSAWLGKLYMKEYRKGGVTTTTIAKQAEHVSAKLLLPCITALIFIASSLNALAQTYSATGNMIATYYSWSNKTGETQDTSFTAWIEDRHWLLRIQYATNWFSLVGGDGTNTYYVLVDPTSSNLLAPASVFYGNFPRDQLDRVTVPWLALCSSDYFSQHEDRDAIPSLWSRAQIDPMAHVCSTTVVQFSDPPYVPKDISWITSSNLIRTASENKDLRIEGASVQDLDKRTVDFVATVSSGKTLGTYHVLAATNINGEVFPTAFELDAYGYFSPEQQKNSQKALDANKGKIKGLKDTIGETWLLASYKGTIIKFTTVKGHVELPHPGLPMGITDYRLSSRSNGVDFVTYKSDSWKPQVNPELMAILETKLSQPRHGAVPSKPISATSQRLFVILFVIIFVSPVVIWAAYKVKKSSNQHRKH